MNRRDAVGAAHATGMVLVAVLLLLALIALLACAGGEMWATAVKREREAQLLFVGDQYRHAIDSYWRASPGPVRMLPRSLSDLLLDRRRPVPVQHLRRAYRDPMDEAAEWGVVKGPAGIAGVYSTSDAAPIKRGGFAERYAQFEHASAYKDWRFVADSQRLLITSRQPSKTPGLSTPAGDPR
jgi:type II secretory pathway pseudopilin PulG